MSDYIFAGLCILVIVGILAILILIQEIYIERGTKQRGKAALRRIEAALGAAGGAGGSGSAGEHVVTYVVGAGGGRPGCGSSGHGSLFSKEPSYQKPKSVAEVYEANRRRAALKRTPKGLTDPMDWMYEVTGKRDDRLRSMLTLKVQSKILRGWERAGQIYEAMGGRREPVKRCW